MEKISFVILDTNIIIEIFKNNSFIIQKCSELGFENLLISDVTVGEFYAGTLNKREFPKIKKHIERFPVLHINEEISKTMAKLMETFCLSHHPYMGDMLIAATALYYDIPVYTLNVKDFKHIPNLQIA